MNIEIDMDMGIPLHQNEIIIYKGDANHFKGIESVGGRLYLTNKRLFFKSHGLNIQTHELSIDISDIIKAGKKNFFWIIPNGIYVKTKQNKKEFFVVWDRDDWIEEINKLL